MISSLSKSRMLYNSAKRAAKIASSVCAARFSSQPATSQSSSSSQNLLSFYDFPVIDLELDKESELYKSNMASSSKINKEFKAVIGKILEGGPKSAHDKLKERKKLSVRERISKLLD